MLEAPLLLLTGQVMDSKYYEKLGREVLADGSLYRLRQRLNLARNAMSELLHVSPITYTSWEQRDVRVWKTTAVRIGLFYERAIQALKQLETEDIDIGGLIPFHLVATQLGIPQELLLARYRDGEIPAIDTGILGLWVNPGFLEPAILES